MDMLCQSCNKNNATIHYKSNVNGSIKEMFLCPECAEKQGITKKSAFKPIDSLDSFFGKGSDDIFGGLFAGMVNQTGAKTATDTKVCPMCGMRFAEFLHGGKIGCAECYRTFSSSLYPTVKRIHGNVEHTGKVPEGKKDAVSLKKKVEQLKSKLQEAIDRQEYEMAAKYRDEIRELENGGGKENV